VIAYPTEGVYGLGCDPDNEAAVRRLLSLKGRSPTKGFILIADSFKRIERFVRPMPEHVARRVLPTWPGPVTWVLPAKFGVPQWLRGRHGTVAVRVTDHPLCRALCRAAWMPLVSTSANRAGHRAALSAAEVRRAFPVGLGYVLQGDLGGRPGPSEIRDAWTGKVIRPCPTRESLHERA
jgi:L-threonylcarbamoyladenylate synthase